VSTIITLFDSGPASLGVFPDAFAKVSVAAPRKTAKAFRELAPVIARNSNQGAKALGSYAKMAKQLQRQAKKSGKEVDRKFADRIVGLAFNKDTFAGIREQRADANFDEFDKKLKGSAGHRQFVLDHIAVGLGASDGNFISLKPINQRIESRIQILIK